MRYGRATRLRVMGLIGLLVAGPTALPLAAQEVEPLPLPEAAAPSAKPLRDPFRPFTLDLRPPKKAANPKTPLEQYDIGALTLVAVIWDTANPKAMVEDATGFGYTISVGMSIGTANGVVKAIEQDKVIIEEEYIDFYGEKKKTQVVLKLKIEEGENKP